MNKKIGLALFAACALLARNANARTLEDLLKEKGVVTDEELKSVAKESKTSYKIGDGFTLMSPDENYKLSLGARLQTRYTLTDKEVNSYPGSTDVSKFEVKRLYLWLKGNAFTKDLTYKVQYNFAGDNSSAAAKNNGSLLEAFMNYRIADEAQIEVGQDDIPFARQEITSSGAQEFVDRSFATNFFKPTYDIGLNIHGKVAKGLLYYDTGIWNGTGQNTPRGTNTPAFNARLAFNPLGDVPYSEGDFDRTEKPLVSIGSSFFMNTLRLATTAAGASSLETNFGDGYLNTSNGWLGKGFSTLGKAGATENLTIQQAEMDLAFRWLGASAEAEYFIGQAEGNSTGKELRSHGFYAQAGYFIIPQRLQVAARYSYVDPNRAVTNDLITQTQGAVSYYFAKHNLKIQADVTNIHTQPAMTDDMEYRLQAQVIF